MSQRFVRLVTASRGNISDVARRIAALVKAPVLQSHAGDVWNWADSLLCRGKSEHCPSPNRVQTAQKLQALVPYRRV